MKQLAPLLVFLVLGDVISARPIQHWPYDKLTDKADLIVIATPTLVVDTKVKTTIPGIQRGTANGARPIPAIKMETTFQVLAVLKGDKDTGELVFLHLREENPPEIQVNGPGLVSFSPDKKKRFLLFLKREALDKYSSLTGQTDPVQGIKDLGTYP